MQFLYLEKCGEKSLEISGDAFAHVILSRREKVGALLRSRNLKDGTLYTYKIDSIAKKSAQLTLQDRVKEERGEQKKFHLIWCLIDPKSIEKSLPTLNEIGVSKISFLHCARSQKSFRLDFERMQRILIYSCEQCGRVDIMEIEEIKSLEMLLKEYQDIAVLDFGGDSICATKRLLVGCEGGFDANERELLKSCKRYSFATQNILKSESACIAAAAKILL